MPRHSLYASAQAVAGAAAVTGAVAHGRPSRGPAAHRVRIDSPEPIIAIFFCWQTKQTCVPWHMLHRRALAAVSWRSRPTPFGANRFVICGRIWRRDAAESGFERANWDRGIRRK